MKKKKLFFSYIYILATLIVIAILISNSVEVEQFEHAISNLDVIWLTVCIMSVLMFWITDSLLIKQITSYIAQEKMRFWVSFRYSIIGLYYCALTPLATGGQPIQIMHMKNDGMGIGKSTAIISVKAFAYEFSICMMYVVFIILRGGYFYTNYTSLFWISIAGFLLNLLGLFIIIMAMKNSDIARRICKFVIRILHKIKLIKHVEKRNAKIDKTIDEFSDAASFISAHTGQTIFSIFISCVNMFFLLIMPYFVYRAFGLTEYGWLEMLALNTFMYFAITFVPTPGTSFAAEGGFRLIFITMFGGATMLAVGMWRILTYYLILIVGSAFVIISQVIYAYSSKHSLPTKKRG